MSVAADNAELKARLARLTPAKRDALLAKLGQRMEPRRAAPPPLVSCPERASAGDGPLVVPASSAQRRMWFLQRYAPDSPAYNTAKLFHLHGPVDAVLLERALRLLAVRHETLRTTFTLRGAEVMQVVARAPEFNLETAALDSLPAEARAARLSELADGVARRPFDLERGPLWRGWLARLGPDAHALAVVVHHIVFDGWSVGVFCRELGSIYSSLVAGRLPERPELRVQYADFTRWQENFLRDATLARLTGHWRRKLENAPPALDLPADRPRPLVESLRGANRKFTLPRALRAELAALAQREEVTLFMVLLAAFKVLLFRHSAQEDVTVGVPFANRNPRETEALIGCFLNTLPLHTGLAGNPTFTELLQRVKQTVLEAHDHADLPFEHLVQLLPTGRDLSRSPWFQYFFQLRNVPRELIEAGPLRSEMTALPTGTAKFTISLHVDEEDGELACDWEYDTALFDAETIDRMAGRWETLLRGIVAQPESRIAALPLLPEGERRLLAEWNRTKADYPRDRCVHQLFEEQASRTPDAVAVVYGEQRLTYRELNVRADALARHLGGLGVKPETPVGVCVERSLEKLVALLGVLKAGGAYVPLDPHYPLERLAFIVADSGARVVLTQTALRGRLPEAGLELVLLDAPLPAVSTGPTAPPSVNPDQLAYVIYTSGSTGRPKGVEVRHASVVNFLWDMRGRLGLTAHDALLAVTSICFDISVLELFLPLAVGARVVVCSDAAKSDGAALTAELERHGITCLQATPATWRLLLGAGWRGDARLLALCGGEALAEDLAAALLARCRQLWNLYGPTETTIWSTATLVRPGEPVLIGRPLANTQVHILDAHGQSVPIGVPGELLIGGDGLARGYRNQPELTTERFVAGPAGLDGSDRLYRTGDRCRWRAGGDIEFLGRLDHQIKLRGFRVEPGEIEAALRQQAGVREAAVLAREDSPGDVRLVAYVVAAPAALALKALRETLAQRLPDYMVPAALVFLPALPLTPNGKLDRAALPKPEPQPAAASEGLAQPETLLEQRLVELWRRTLGTSEVSPEDDFFDLGGHSLLAVRLVMDVSKLAGQPVPIAALFHAPTPRKLARLLAGQGQLPPWTALVPLQSTGSSPPVFFVHGLGGSVGFFLPLARRLPAHQPVYGLQAIGQDGRITQRETIEEMAAHYVREIVSLQPEGPYFLAGYSAGGLIAYELAQQLHRAGRPVAMLGLLDTQPMLCRMPWRVFARAIVPWMGERCRRHWRAGTWFSTTRTLFAYLAGRWRGHWQTWWNLPRRDRHRYWRGRYAALKYWLMSNRLPQQPPATGECNPAGPEPTEEDPLLRASSEYRLRDYPGPVDYFRSESTARSCLLVWQGLARGGLRAHRIQGVHSELLAASRLDSLAQTFTAALHQAQQPKTGTPRTDGSKTGPTGCVGHR
jgi:amino acid adenylation domain-containing protein